MRMITLNDGSVFHVSACGAADGFLWITVTDDITMPEAVNLFGNAENTQNIHHDFNGNDVVDFAGYTELIRIEKRDGLTITLKRGDGN